MATRVFADEELAALRRFPEIGREELFRFFTLTPADVAFVDPGRGRGPADRLGLAVALCSLPWLGFVPDDVASVPRPAVARLAEQLGVDPEAIRSYGRRAKTRTEHLRLVARYLGWRAAGSLELKELDEFLLARVMEHDSALLLFRLACEYLISARVIRPGPVTVVERVAHVREQARRETFDRLAHEFTDERGAALDGLLVTDPAIGMTRLRWLSTGPVEASPAAVKAEVAKLEFLRCMDAHTLDLSVLPAERRRFLATVGRRLTPQALQRRYPILLTLGELEQTLADGDGPVRLDDEGNLVISPLTAEDIPAEAVALKAELTEMLPFAPIVSLLIELDKRTGFLDCFTHAGGKQARSPELKRNLIAVLIAYSTNLGLTRMADACGISYDVLAWTAEWYVREETLRAVNLTIIDYHRKLPLTPIFGAGTLSSSDGQRFPTRGKSVTALTWTSLRAIRSGIGVFATWLGAQGPTPPWLSDDPAGVRVLMLEFLGYVRTLTASTGPNPGKPLSDLRVNDIATNVEQFYLFMHDHQETAARALNEPGWLRLGPQHAKLWRRGETRRPAVRPERREVIDDTALSQIMANLHLLGAPVEEGGFADEQAMRIVMLVARTGRRVSEIRARPSAAAASGPALQSRRGRR